MASDLIKESLSASKTKNQPEKLAMWKEMHDAQITDVRKV